MRFSRALATCHFRCCRCWVLLLRLWPQLLRVLGGKFPCPNHWKPGFLGTTPTFEEKNCLVFGSWRVCTASWEDGLQWRYVFKLFGFQHKKTLSPSPLLHHVLAILSTSHFGCPKSGTLIYASFREMMAWILMVPPFLDQSSCFNLFQLPQIDVSKSQTHLTPASPPASRAELVSRRPQKASSLISKNRESYFLPATHLRMVLPSLQIVFILYNY